ncbi:MAG: acetate/propionate family kinase [Pikeienuella sp.]
MTDHALTLNAGSSSIKFGLFELGAAADGGPEERASGLVERIGGQAHIKAKSVAGKRIADRDLSPEESAGHGPALKAVLGLLEETFPGREIGVVGHRVVHGGPIFGAPVAVTEQVMSDLTNLEPFAPLHQPHNLAGIRAAQEAFPKALQVACFDTAFHRNHPWVNDTFALPRRYYDKGVRRYGFHGLSYDYIAGRLAEIAPQIHAGRVVVAHLGNGASMCGMLGGRSIGSTMGFTALDGLPMGTRCGQLDPGVILYLIQQEGLSADDISDLLYKESGLLGLSGLSNDMRTLEAADTPEAAEAIDYFVFRVQRELGALAAVLGGLDALIFAGGIGENSRTIRHRVCQTLDWLGIELDRTRNEANEMIISTDLSRARVMVIETDEEVVIARAAARLLSAETEAAQ